MQEKMNKFFNTKLIRKKNTILWENKLNTKWGKKISREKYRQWNNSVNWQSNRWDSVPMEEVGFQKKEKILPSH